jgi:hypothetical protein
MPIPPGYFCHKSVSFLSYSMKQQISQTGSQDFGRDLLGEAGSDASGCKHFNGGGVADGGRMSVSC